MTNDEWNLLEAGEDYYWDEVEQRVVLRPPREQRGLILDGEIRAPYGVPPEVVARAKAAHFRKPVLLPGRGTPTPSRRKLRGLWPCRMRENKAGEADADDSS